MPLVHSGSDAAFNQNVKTLMGEIGQSPHVKNRAQALAISYAIKRRGKDDGGPVIGLGIGQAMPRLIEPENIPLSRGFYHPNYNLQMPTPANANRPRPRQFGGPLPAVTSPGAAPAPPPGAGGITTPAPTGGVAGLNPDGTPAVQPSPTAAAPTGILGPTGLAGTAQYTGPITPRHVEATPGVAGAPNALGAQAAAPQGGLAGTQAVAQRRQPGMALGGMLPSLHTLPDRFTRQAEGGIRSMEPRVHAGPIMGHTMGRGDRVPMKVAAGSYVLPADHISHMGEGNTMAGFKHTNAMFGGGPFGMGLNRPGGFGVHMPRIAQGGAPYHGGQGEEGGEPVDIMAADGEYVLTPQQIKQKFGNLKRGHEALDEWVVIERKKHIKKLQKLPGPVRD